jgi:DNA-binding CsgD family transcriptional regulator
MDGHDSLDDLTRRQQECLALVGAGLSSKEIARVLGIEAGTVDTTIKRAFRITGITDRRLLARRLRDRDPELIQSLIQRLGHPEKLLVSRYLDASEDRAASGGGGGAPSWWWPVPTAERQWNDLSAWQKRLWAVAIALGLLAMTALLVGLSHHVLTGLPARP